MVLRSDSPSHGAITRYTFLALFATIAILLIVAAANPATAAPTNTATASGATLTTSTEGIRTSLWDEVGGLRRSVTAAEVADWQRQLHNDSTSPELRALLHLRLGEWELAAQEEPARGEWHFRVAEHLTAPHDPLHGEAAYNRAVSLYWQCAYQDSTRAFRSLLNPRAGLTGFNPLHASLWLSHSTACEGFHGSHAALGIPEPSRLDPECAAAALAMCRHQLGLSSDRSQILSHIRVTGRGSSDQDIVRACRQFGDITAYEYWGSDQALKVLPKPLIAYVEHDHFVAVLKTDKKGVTYSCSDCGAWPGGRITLSWNQWKAMEVSELIPIVTAGTLIEPQQSTNPKAINPPVQGEDGPPPPPAPTNCGGDLYSLRCPKFPLCPKVGSGVGKGGPACPDPVNVATLEEELSPEPDLTVYNPTGPSVVWQRSYNSMRGTEGVADDPANILGIGWSNPYSMSIASTSTALGRYLSLPNGGRVQFSRPNSNTGPETCTIATPGLPFTIVEYKTPSGSSFTYQWIVYYTDGSYWSTPAVSSSPTFPSRVYFTSITDRQGHSIYINGNPNTTFTITQGSPTGTALLTVLEISSNGGNATGLEVRDCYGRSVFYTIATQYTPFSLTLPAVPYQVLTGVSQIVPTGTAPTSAPSRSQYTYDPVPAGGAFFLCLATHTVPSPTGTGTSVAKLTYKQDGTMYVQAILDANGVGTRFDKQTGNKTQITKGPVVYTMGYDNLMAETSCTDGTNSHLIFQAAYGSSPYYPSWIKDGTGKQTNYQWDAMGRPLSTTTPLGVTTTYSYDNPTTTGMQIPRLQSVTTPGVGTTTLNYYPGTYTVSSVVYPSPTGTGTQTASYTYDNYGNILTVTAPSSVAGQTITDTFSYTTDGTYSQSTAIGQPVAIIDNTGATVAHLRYDSQGNLGSAWDATGRTVTAHYNIANQPDTVYYPTAAGGPNPAKEVISYLYPDGPSTGNMLYDTNGVIARQYAPILGKEGEVLGAQATVNEPEPARVVYDNFYRVQQLVHPDGTTTNYFYNPAGYLSEVDTPGASPTTPEVVKYTSYDGAGRLLSATDATGLITNYAYATADGQISSVKFPDPGSPVGSPTYTGPNAQNNASFTYDSYGRLQNKTDGTGTVTIAYNSTGGMPASVATLYNGPLCSAAPLSTALTLTYTYNPDGSRASLNTPAGLFTASYDTLGRLSEVRNPLGHAQQYAYRPTGTDTGELKQVTTGTYPNSSFSSIFATGFATDGLDRLTQLIHRIGSDPNGTGALLAQFGNPTASTPIQYDAAGNVTNVPTQLDSAAPANLTRSEQFAYDPMDRLTQHTNGTLNHTFAYDAMGNATTFQSQAGIGYNNRNEPTASGFTYNANGDPSVHNSWSTYFDCLGNLTSAGSNVPTSAPFQAGYSLSGQRVFKQSGSNTAARIYYLYDGTDPICEINTAGQVVALNTFGGAGLISRATFVGGQTTPNTETFYVFDERGNVAERLNKTGGVISRHAYKAYGGEWTTPNSTGDPWSFGAQDGYQTDPETGWIYCTFRYYDPSAGRWLSRDPVGYGGGLNLYGYCGQNPVNASDPLGLYSLSDYGSDVVKVFKGYGSALDGAFNPIAIGYGLGQATAQLSQIAGACGFQAAGNALAQGIVHSFTDWMTTDDPEAFGASFGNTLISVGTELAPYASCTVRCFAVGTPVQMADGTSKPIESVKKGDLVLSFDATKNKTVASRVLSTSVRESDTGTVSLTIEDDSGNREVIECTPEHPLFVPGKGWTPAGDLGIGTSIVTRAGSGAKGGIGQSSAHVVVTKHYASRRVTVCNLNIENTHSYFVGSVGGGLWVHNSYLTNKGTENFIKQLSKSEQVALGDVAENVWREHLKEQGIQLAPKANSSGGGPDAEWVGGTDPGWDWAELKPNSITSRKAGGAEIRARYSNGATGRSQLYLYDTEGGGAFFFSKAKLRKPRP